MSVGNVLAAAGCSDNEMHVMLVIVAALTITNVTRLLVWKRRK